MKWHLEKRKIKDLKNNPKNPRQLSKHDAQHLKKSIESFGQCEPVVINTDNTIIGGHQRVKVMKGSGHKEVDVYVPDEALTTEQCDELNIRLNRNHGEWDFDVLANEWEIPDLLEWGFSENEIMPVIEGEGKEDNNKQKNKTIKINLDDCLKIESVKLAIETLLIDLGVIYEITIA